MSGARALFATIAALCAILPLQGLAADVPASAPARASDSSKDKNADCSGWAYGSKFFQLGETGFCGKAGYDVMGFAAKDFAAWDIAMVGQRLPSMTYAAGVPVLFYYNKNFGAQTFYPYPGVDAQVNFMAARRDRGGPPRRLRQPATRRTIAIHSGRRRHLRLQQRGQRLHSRGAGRSGLGSPGRARGRRSAVDVRFRALGLLGHPRLFLAGEHARDLLHLSCR